MALTDYDKKNLSASDQKKIQDATDKWNAANAKGDKAGMASAAAEAAAVRNNAGYKTDDTGKYTGSYSSGGGGGSKKTYSQYTAPTLGDTWDADTDYQAIINNAVDNGDYVTAAKAERLRNQKITQTGVDIAKTNLYKGWLDSTDYSTIAKDQMANGASWEDVLATYNARYNKSDGTVGLDQYKDDQLMKMMQKYIYDQQALEGYENEMNRWEEENQRPTQPESDPRIDKILNQILNRDDFSYDVANDPLYQQYAEMYRREGDRAMRDTLAEVASGAGGMNTYAITAAQQANNYYNSQLNDKIPELYQLAYDMYLNDLELKVQDLGILQDMDATQYNRYRDTINDWYADKNFAYNMYNNAVQQGNWQANYDNTNYWNQKYFDNDNYWKGIDNDWRQKEFDNTNDWNQKYFDADQKQLGIENGFRGQEISIQQSQIAQGNKDREQENAQNQLLYLIEAGITPTDKTLIAKAGWTEADVNALVAQVQAENAGTIGTYKSSGGSGGGKKSGGGSGGSYGYDNSGGSNYSLVASACNELASEGDEWGAAAYAREAYDSDIITQTEYNKLVAGYNPMIKAMFSFSAANHK